MPTQIHPNILHSITWITLPLLCRAAAMTYFQSKSSLAGRTTPLAEADQWAIISDIAKATRLVQAAALGIFTITELCHRLYDQPAGINRIYTLLSKLEKEMNNVR